MQKLIRTGLIAPMLFACAVGDALAQKTVGEVLDMGERFLTATEIKELFAGATYSGLLGGKSFFEEDHLADGTITGHSSAQNTAGTRHTNAPTTGTWSVNDKDEYCKQWKSGSASGRTCLRVLSLGRDYYVARSQGGRDATVDMREIKKK
jgi:hypothetical protein